MIPFQNLKKKPKRPASAHPQCGQGFFPCTCTPQRLLWVWVMLRASTISQTCHEARALGRWLAQSRSLGSSKRSMQWGDGWLGSVSGVELVTFSVGFIRTRTISSAKLYRGLSPNSVAFVEVFSPVFRQHQGNASSKQHLNDFLCGPCGSNSPA